MCYNGFNFQCLGVIESVYWKSNEESVIGDRQKVSSLESKKPVSATSTSNTRADRVHGETTRQPPEQETFLITYIKDFFSTMFAANASSCLLPSHPMLALLLVLSLITVQQRVAR
jgi:hypothetical protein